MDNDTLIDQARQLYACLHVEQYELPIAKKTNLNALITLFCGLVVAICEG
jgi:hypothetical protein